MFSKIILYCQLTVYLADFVIAVCGILTVYFNDFVVEEKRVDRHVIQQEVLVLPEDGFRDGDFLEVLVLENVTPAALVGKAQGFLQQLRFLKPVV